MKRLRVLNPRPAFLGIMETEEQFVAVVQYLLDQGVSDEVIDACIGTIGDVIEIDGDGLWVLRDDSGTVRARVTAMPEEE